MVSKADIVAMSFKLFDDYDTDGSGFLQPKQFRKVITQVFHEVNKNYPIDKAHLNRLFTIYDANGDNKLTRKELGKAIEMFLEPIYINVKQ